MCGAHFIPLESQSRAATTSQSSGGNSAHCTPYTKSWWRCGITEWSLTASNNTKCYNGFGRVWQFLIRLNTRLWCSMCFLVFNAHTYTLQLTTWSCKTLHTNSFSTFIGCWQNLEAVDGLPRVSGSTNLIHPYDGILFRMKRKRTIKSKKSVSTWHTVLHDPNHGLLVKRSVVAKSKPSRRPLASLGIYNVCSPDTRLEVGVGSHMESLILFTQYAWKHKTILKK